MRKNSEFDEIYSEEDMDFNNTATKLNLKQQKNPLQKLVQDTSKLSNIAKGYIQEGKADQIKKRKSESQNETKLSYRQRSKMRYTGAVNNNNNMIE